MDQDDNFRVDLALDPMPCDVCGTEIVVDAVFASSLGGESTCLSCASSVLVADCDFGLARVGVCTRCAGCGDLLDTGDLIGTRPGEAWCLECTREALRTRTEGVRFLEQA